jgi:hypothetical protein
MQPPPYDAHTRAVSTERSTTVRGLHYYPVLHEVGDSFSPKGTEAGGLGASTTEASTTIPTLYDYPGLLAPVPHSRAGQLQSRRD